MRDYFIVGGLVKEIKTTTGKFFGDFNLTRAIRNTLKRFNTTFYDDCCPEASEGLPVRFKLDKSGIEFYDPETKTWQLWD